MENVFLELKNTKIRQSDDLGWILDNKSSK